MNNEDLFKTIIWISSNLGQKKYIIPNEINIIKTNLFLIFLTHKYFYFKFCMLYGILLRNDIFGSVCGFKSYLLIRGLGFKASITTNVLLLKIGFSHEVKYKIPCGIKITILPKKSRTLCIFSNDRQQLKEVMLRIRNFRVPNSYKHQGIFFYNEKIILKDNKRGVK